MTLDHIALSEAPSLRSHSAAPGRYLLHRELIGAINAALALGQPLLLTGEPGTGKTRLAYRIAHDLHQQQPDFLPEPLVFVTKTNSTAQELFYQYDALRHFHDANVRQAQAEAAPDIAHYIDLQAYGQAIALTNAAEIRSGRFLRAERPRSSVVLIDEIDKAPRDFPNDLLSEVENAEFRIKEANQHLIRQGEGQRIVLVLTSNSEKHLPEAFLRRCVFYHIPFPDAEQLQRIVQVHFGEDTPYRDEALIEHFLHIRETVRKKKPATAELIAWLRILELADFVQSGIDLRRLSTTQRDHLRMSYSVLAKTQEDLRAIEARFL